jgi:hypothetical protein
MKKILFVLILCLPSIMTHAQKPDKKLIIGRWDLYYAQSQGNSVCRDSLAEFIERTVKELKVNYYGTHFTAGDSLKLVKDLTDRFTDIFKTYFIFDNKGNSTVLYCESGECKEETGPYKWIAKNQLTQKKKDGTDTAILTIRSLTATTLVTKVDDLTTGVAADLTFTKAK